MHDLIDTASMFLARLVKAGVIDSAWARRSNQAIARSTSSIMDALAPPTLMESTKDVAPGSDGMQQYRGLTSLIPIAGLLFDASGAIIEINPLAERLWNGTPFSTGHLTIDHEKSDPIESVRDLIAYIGDRDEAEYQVAGTLHISDRRVPIRLSGKSLYDEQDLFIGGLVCFTDLSDSRNREIAVQQRADTLARILDSLPIPVYETNAGGTITYFNAAAIDFAGRTPHLYLDRWCITSELQNIDGTSLPHEDCPMAYTLREQRPVRGKEAIAVRPDGRMVPFAPFPTPLHNDKNQFVGAVNMLLDLSYIRETYFAGGRTPAEIYDEMAGIWSILTKAAAALDDHARLLGSVDRLLHHCRAAMDMAGDAPNVEGIGVRLKPFVEGLLTDTVPPGPQRIQIWGSEMCVSSKIALLVGALLQELARSSQNAGAISSSGGFVGLSWKTTSIEDRNVLVVEWQEYCAPEIYSAQNGVEIKKLLTHLVEEGLEGCGKLAFDRPGPTCAIQIPI